MGGFAVDNATLTRFFTFHFMVPFIVAAMAAVHIFFLHTTGRNNPLGVNSDAEKIPFHWYYRIKDVVGFVVLLSLLLSLVLFSPNYLGEPDNFIAANPMVTPPHIVPEYFLFAYAILRSIPNKLGGVLGLFGSLLILLSLPVRQNIILKIRDFVFHADARGSVARGVPLRGREPILFGLLFLVFFTQNPVTNRLGFCDALISAK